jgi:hypothetical protein
MINWPTKNGKLKTLGEMTEDERAQARVTSQMAMKACRGEVPKKVKDFIEQAKTSAFERLQDGEEPDGNDFA